MMENINWNGKIYGNIVYINGEKKSPKFITDYINKYFESLLKKIDDKEIVLYLKNEIEKYNNLQNIERIRNGEIVFSYSPLIVIDSALTWAMKKGNPTEAIKSRWDRIIKKINEYK